MNRLHHGDIVKYNGNASYQIGIDKDALYRVSHVTEGEAGTEYGVCNMLREPIAGAFTRDGWELIKGEKGYTTEEEALVECMFDAGDTVIVSEFHPQGHIRGMPYELNHKTTVEIDGTHYPAYVFDELEGTHQERYLDLLIKGKKPRTVLPITRAPTTDPSNGWCPDEPIGIKGTISVNVSEIPVPIADEYRTSKEDTTSTAEQLEASYDKESLAALLDDKNHLQGIRDTIASDETQLNDISTMNAAQLDCKAAEIEARRNQLKDEPAIELTTGHTYRTKKGIWLCYDNGWLTKIHPATVVNEEMAVRANDREEWIDGDPITEDLGPLYIAVSGNEYCPRLLEDYRRIDE